MDSIKNIITQLHLISPSHKTNKFWLLAEEIAEITGTKPNRWLRMIKTNELATERAKVDLKEFIKLGGVKNPLAYFIWLHKKYAKELSSKIGDI